VLRHGFHWRAAPPLAYLQGPGSGLNAAARGKRRPLEAASCGRRENHDADQWKCTFNSSVSDSSFSSIWDPPFRVDLRRHPFSPLESGAPSFLLPVQEERYVQNITSASGCRVVRVQLDKVILCAGQIRDLCVLTLTFAPTTPPKPQPRTEP